MKKYFIISTIALSAIILRLFFAYYGHNYDFESYLIVKDLISSGQNVYANTSRYNYGPIWFFILYLFDLITNSDFAFRILIALFLSLVDCSIAYILYQKHSTKVALLYLFNPISIIVTGFISQFDNLAILITLVSVVIFGTEDKGKLSKRNIIGLLTLGISLATKHIFFMFPLWLALKQKGKMRKLIVLVLPLMIFSLAFLPFLGDGGASGIWQNIFRYSSVKNAPLLNLFLPESFVSTALANALFLISLLLIGLFFYKKNLLELLAIYSLSVVVFSPAIIHNHLAIAVLGIAIYPNVFHLLFTLLTTYIFTLDRLGLGIEYFIDHAPKHFLFRHSSVNIFGVPILLLFLGYLYNHRKEWPRFKAFSNWLNKSITEQKNSL